MNPKLELLYVISRLSWGGLEMNILRLANEMIKRGHSVTIACNLKGRLFQELVKIFNGEKRKIETVGLSSNFAENLATLLKILKQKQFSIIHIFNSSDLKLVSLAVILQAGNQALILDPQIGVGVSKKDLLHKIFYKKVDTVIAISKDVANGFLQNLPIDENKLKLIYPGVDVGKFNFSHCDISDNATC
ncbi:Glycosyltransferase Family 4 [Candidatus Kryptonium thompsonii]|nr:Glycosyltransferase Family 4 [Candidatus Kryptonium thompsoni]